MKTIKAAGHEVDAAELLAALYNNSKPLGLGFLQATPEDMTKEEAAELLDSEYPYFDYLKGRVMKCDFGGDEVSGRLYDRDNGTGAFEGVVLGLAVTA